MKVHFVRQPLTGIQSFMHQERAANKANGMSDGQRIDKVSGDQIFSIPLPDSFEHTDLASLNILAAINAN